MYSLEGINTQHPFGHMCININIYRSRTLRICIRRIWSCCSRASFVAVMEYYQQHDGKAIIVPEVLDLIWGCEKLC